MPSSRTATALVGLLLSLLVSAAVWYYFDTFLLFLLVPFVPILLRGGSRGERQELATRTCPRCGYETRDPRYEFCPVDGTRLE